MIYKKLDGRSDFFCLGGTLCHNKKRVPLAFSVIFNRIRYLYKIHFYFRNQDIIRTACKT